MSVPWGILLPESVLHTTWFTVFATFVAINTVVYVTLSLTKIFPVIYFRGRRGRERRTTNRSIYPGAAP